MNAIPQHWNIFINRWIIIAFGAWLLAQLIKLIINYVQTRRVDFRYLVSSGNMPSAHCALVSSLATTIGITEGLDSLIFAISGVLAMIVIYDAATVRHTVGQQSTILNRILDDFFRPDDPIQKRMREFIGHTRLEVIVGVLLGVFIGWLGITITA
jgi:acid phosphatase family membrane protein YuiD